MLKLIDPNSKYIEQYNFAYETSLELVNNGTLKKHNMMFENPKEIDIVKMYMDNRDETKLKPTYVPSYDYFLVEDDKFIGVINIRVKLTPNLLKYGGHIGYSINPKYWRMGYGTKILALGLEKAKDLIIEDKILITCDDDNIGSYKVIENNGGVLENKVENIDGDEKFITRRYWIKK